MKPSNLKQLLTAAIVARKPVFVHGAPGIGKSDVIAQAAAAIGARCVVSHPVVLDPTYFTGLPWMQAGQETAQFVPFGDLAEILNATEPVVWFLDDFSQAATATQAAVMQLLLARHINGHKLPDCVTLVLAGNRRQDRAGSAGVIEPVKSRCVMVGMEVDTDEWTTWALEAGLPWQLAAFHRYTSGRLLSDFAPTSEMTVSPSPRGWARVGEVMGWDLPAELFLEAITGLVGEGAAVEFVGFLELCAAMPSLDEILLTPDTAPIPESDQISALWSVARGLAARANASNFDRIYTYLERMRAAGHGEFAVLCISEAMNKAPEIKMTAGFMKLAAGELGKLWMGQ